MPTNQILAHSDTWRAFLKELTSDEIVELDRLVFAARMFRDARILCDDPSCNCRREA